MRLVAAEKAWTRAQRTHQAGGREAPSARRRRRRRRGRRSTLPVAILVRLAISGTERDPQ